jgi:hypothetical protein
MNELGLNFPAGYFPQSYIRENIISSKKGKYHNISKNGHDI